MPGRRTRKVPKPANTSKPPDPIKKREDVRPAIKARDEPMIKRR